VTNAHPNCEPVVYLLQAICLYHLGRHEACRKLVKKLTLSHPNNVDALCLLAALEPPTKEGVQESFALLQQALAFDGGHPVVLAQYGQHKYYQRDFDEAEISLANAVRRSSCHRIRAGAEYVRGRIHHEREEYEQAQARYAECLRQLPDHVPCQFAGAQVLLALNRTEDAIKLADKVRAVCPKNKDVLRLSAALLCRHPERNAEARKYLDAVPLADDDLDGWRLRAGAFALAEESGEMQAALEAYGKVVELTEATAGQEVDAEVWNNIGTLRTTVGDFANAKDALDRAEKQLKARLAAETVSGVTLRRLKGLLLTVKFNLARWYEESTGFDQLRKARDTYKEIVSECPQYVDAWIRLVQQALRRGDFSRAGKFLQDALEASPTNVDLLILSAEVKEQLGDLDAALAEAEKAFAAGEEDPSASTCLATLHYKKGCAVEGRRKVYREDQRKDRKAASIAKEQSEGHFKKALEIFQKTLSSDKGSFFAMNGIGAVLAHKDKRHEAKVIFKSLEENLGERGTEILREVNVAVNQGHLLMDYGRSDEKAFEKAVQYYEQAFNLDPENADVILFLATAYYKVKKSKEAQKTLNWGLFLYPSDPRMHMDYATILELHGQKIVSDQNANYDPAIVKKGAGMLSAAASRFEFVQELRNLRFPGGDREETAAKAGLSRATVQALDDLECSYLTASQTQSTGDFQKNLEKHLDYCQSSAVKAKDWADRLETNRAKEQEKHRLEKKQQEAKKQDEFLREKLREEDKQRHQRIQNERAEALHREMNNVTMPEVSDKPGETKIAPPKRPRERQREEDEAAKQPRTAEPAEAAEPADEQEVDVLFAELFGDDE
jgi:tetratricopeptide (TPR) repeat protein